MLVFDHRPSASLYIADKGNNKKIATRPNRFDRRIVQIKKQDKELHKQEPNKQKNSLQTKSSIVKNNKTLSTKVMHLTGPLELSFH